MRFEKLPMRALSAGSMAITNASAACATNVKFARMLPLRSRSSTTVMGCRSFEKRVNGCGLPLSRIAVGQPGGRVRVEKGVVPRHARTGGHAGRHHVHVQVRVIVRVLADREAAIHQPLR